MEEQKNKRVIEFSGANRPIIIDNLLKTILLMLLVVALGVLAINQTLGFFYKAHFLKSPCTLCADLNPDVKTCIQELSTPRASYWLGNDTWSDPFQRTIFNVTLPKS